MTYEALIADSITRELDDTTLCETVDEKVRATLAGGLLQNVDGNDRAAVQAEVENYLAHLSSIDLDQPLEDLWPGVGIEAQCKLSAIVLTVKSGKIDQERVAKLVQDEVEELLAA